MVSEFSPLRISYILRANLTCSHVPEVAGSFLFDSPSFNRESNTCSQQNSNYTEIPEVKNESIFLAQRVCPSAPPPVSVGVPGWGCTPTPDPRHPLLTSPPHSACVLPSSFPSEGKEGAENHCLPWLGTMARGARLLHVRW